MKNKTKDLHNRMADLAFNGLTITQIAHEADRTPAYVGKILRASGVKAVRPPQKRKTHSNKNIGVACACLIIKDPFRMDASIGLEAGCTREFVGQVRKQMRDMGVVNR